MTALLVQPPSQAESTRRRIRCTSPIPLRHFPSLRHRLHNALSAESIRSSDENIDRPPAITRYYIDHRRVLVIAGARLVCSQLVFHVAVIVDHL